MPVPNQIRSGVVAVSSGSRMTSCGPRIGAEKEYFRREVSWVAPAKEEYSPAEREVGMDMMGMEGGLMGGFGVGGSVVKVRRVSGVVVLLDIAYIFANSFD